MSKGWGVHTGAIAPFYDTWVAVLIVDGVTATAALGTADDSDGNTWTIEVGDDSGFSCSSIIYTTSLPRGTDPPATAEEDLYDYIVADKGGSWGTWRGGGHRVWVWDDLLDTAEESSSTTPLTYTRQTSATTRGIVVYTADGTGSVTFANVSPGGWFVLDSGDGWSIVYTEYTGSSDQMTFTCSSQPHRIFETSWDYPSP